MREYEVTEVGRFGVLVVQAGGVAALTISTVMAAGILVMAFVENVPSDNPSGMGTLGCLALWSLLIGWIVGLGLINVYPTIWTDEERLVISAFLWARIEIPWAEILDVGAGRVPFGHTLVRARHITPFHRLYGWIYSRTLYPSFVINRRIQDREELLAEINSKAQYAK